MDTKRGLEVLALLRELVDDRAITTVLMTHDARATQFADRVIAIFNGCIDQDASAHARSELQSPERVMATASCARRR